MFTVRDLALLSSRWSGPASERAPSPQSLQLSPSSLLSSPQLPLYLLHLIFHSDSISSSSSPFHLSLSPTSSITVFSSALTSPPCPLPSLSAQPYFLFLPLCPPSSSFSLSLFKCVVKQQQGRSQISGGRGNRHTSPPDPWSLRSVGLPLETRVI